MVSAHNGLSSSVQQSCCECKSLVLAQWRTRKILGIKSKFAKRTNSTFSSGHENCWKLGQQPRKKR